jgi:signal transduction histidine kinase
LPALGLFVSTPHGERSGARADEALESIEASLESLWALFNELLDVSRLDAGVIQPRIRPCSLHGIFAILAREYAPLATRRGCA